jgi:hypothetical protein
VGLLGGLERVAAPDDFEFRLRARMARQRAAEKSWLGRLKFAPGVAAAAVAVCLLAASAFYFKVPRGTDDSVAARQEAPAADASSAATDDHVAPTKEVADVSRERPSAEEFDAARPDKARQNLRAAAVESGGRRSAPRPRRALREDNFGVRVAAVIDGGEGVANATDSATQTVALRTSPETLRVVMRDERGGSYVLPMRSVSFGAQGPVGRDARIVRASHTDKEGVW